MKKIIIMILAVLLLTGCGSNNSTVSSASSPDSEKEELQARVDELEKQLAELKENSMDNSEQSEAADSSIEEASSNSVSSEESIAVEEVEETQPEENTNEEEKVDPSLMSSEEFLKDIVDSYNARSVVATKYTNAEKNTMSNEEMIDYYVECAEAETPFFEKYKDAKFSDLNIQYLCEQYMGGLEKQYRAKEIYNESRNYEDAVDVYNSGYYNRAYVIVELSEYYDAQFGDIIGMKENTASMDMLNEAETRNAAVEHDKVLKTQELLNGIGFYCGDEDGVSGKRTVKSIKRFQEMYGFEPADGMIDDELIDQLQSVYDEKEKG